MSVADYIYMLLSQEEYSFSLDEILLKLEKSEIAVKSELSRLVQKRQILNLRKGFYIILTPRYREIGILPIELYADKLFSYLKKNYYLAFYSAAKFYGASHQQIQKDYIITSLPPIYNISKKNIRIDFFNTSNWSQKNIIQKKSDAGYFNISSPILTIVDLIHYHVKLGGLNRMIAIIDEIAEIIEVNDIENLLTWYPHKSSIQRLGYILEELVVNKTLIELLYKYLDTNGFYPILLSPIKEQKAGKVNNKWKVDVNLELESDI